MQKRWPAAIIDFLYKLLSYNNITPCFEIVLYFPCSKQTDMLDNILQMIREFGQQQVVENPEIPNENNNAVMAEASRAVTGTLQQQVASGNAGNIMDLFRNNDPQEIMRSPVAQEMQTGFMDNITRKLGINKNVAAGLAASFIPMILSKLVHRTNSNDPADNGFNLNDLVKSLTGGSGGHGFGNLVNQFTGNQNGGINPGNLATNAGETGGDQGQQGGLNNLINDFFGR
jgi:hypothetical protein